jgi:hypothetical protein
VKLRTRFRVSRHRTSYTRIVLLSIRSRRDARSDCRNGVDSPDGQPEDNDPQVVEGREEALTNLTPQTA